TLHQRQWSQRRIARELGIDRQTVARYLKQAKPARAPIGSGGEGEESKPARAPIGSGVEGEESKPARAPIGSGGEEEESKPARAPIGSGGEEEESKPARAPIGSGGEEEESKPARAPIGSAQDPNLPVTSAPQVPSRSHQGSLSQCEPFRDIILAKLELGLSAQRIYQDLVT